MIKGWKTKPEWIQEYRIRDGHRRALREQKLQFEMIREQNKRWYQPGFYYGPPAGVSGNFNNPTGND